MTGVVVIRASESMLAVAWIKWLQMEFLKIRIFKLHECLDGGEEALYFHASAVKMSAHE